MSEPEIRDRPPAGGPGAHLLEPADLAALGGIELVSRRVVDGFLMGMHRSPRRGFSAEFAEHRAYQPGDDLRHVDWRMYGRSDRFYVKQFEEETTLVSHLVVDASASMAWTSDATALPPKLWYARQLAACFAHLLLRQGDAVGLAVFDEEIREHVRPRGGRRQWHELVRHLEETGAGTGTAAHRVLRTLAHRLDRRGLVVVLSDLLVEPGPTVEGLRLLRHRGHDVVVVHLLDPGERELPPTGDARFVDPESGEELPVSVADVRAEYRQAVADALEEWHTELGRSGIDHEVVGTDRPLAGALRTFVRRRAALR